MERMEIKQKSMPHRNCKELWYTAIIYEATQLKITEVHLYMDPRFVCGGGGKGEDF